MILKVIGSSSKGNAYALMADNEILLLECGCRGADMMKAIDWQVGKVVGCLVSHQHNDHVGHVKDYMAYGIPVYSNDETEEFVGAVQGERIKGIPEMKPLKLGQFLVIPFYLPHNGVPNYGYLIEHPDMGRSLFITDFELCEWNFLDWKVRHFLIETNYDLKFAERNIPNYRHKLMGHCSLETAIGFVKKNQCTGLQTVTMCHLGDGSTDEGYFIRQMQCAVGPFVQVAIADKGVEVNLGIPF